MAAEIARSPKPGPRVYQVFEKQDANLIRPLMQAAVVGQAFDIVTEADGGEYAGEALASIAFPDLREGAEVDDFSADYVGEPNLLDEVVVKIVDANGTFDVTEDDQVTITAAGVALGAALVTWRTLVSPTRVSTAEDGDEVTFPVGTDLLAAGVRVGDKIVFTTNPADIVTNRGIVSGEVDSVSGLPYEFMITAILGRNVARVALMGVVWNGFIGETDIEAVVRRYPAGTGTIMEQDDGGAGINLPASSTFQPTNSDIDFIAAGLQPGDQIVFIDDSLDMVGVSSILIDNVATPTTEAPMTMPPTTITPTTLAPTTAWEGLGTGVLAVNAPILPGVVFTDADAEFLSAGVKAGDELRFITDESDLSGDGGAVVTRNVKRFRIAQDASSETSITLETALTGESPPSGKYFQYQVVRVNQPVAEANNKRPFTVRRVVGVRNVLLDRDMTAETRTLSRQFEFKVIRTGVPNGPILISYRALRSDLTGTFLEVGADVSGGMTDLVSKLGQISLLNPAALMAYAAAVNTPYAVGVAVATHMDQVGVAAALEVIGSRVEAYGIAIATQDAALQQLVMAHVNDYSNPDHFSGRERYAVCSQRYAGKDTVIETQTGSTNELTVQATRTKVKLGNAATIDFTQVRPGMYINFDPNGTGATVPFNVNSAEVFRSRAKIVAVLSAFEVQLLEAVHANQATAIQDYSIETHDYTKEEIALNVARTSQAIGDRRVVNLFPEDVVMSIAGTDTVVPSYYMAAGIVGRRSAIAPSKPLTNEPIFGFSGVVDRAFSEDQHQIMRGGGTWVLEQLGRGPIVSQHQLTTDRTSVQTQEDSIRTAIDYLAKMFNFQFQTIVGKHNLTKAFITNTCWPLAEAVMKDAVDQGVIDDTAQVVSVARDAIHPDHLKVIVRAPTLKPLNYPDITILIS